MEPARLLLHDMLRQAHHSFITRCTGWRKNNGTDQPIFFLNTLTKTGSESIEEIIRKGRILFVGFVARMEDTRLPKCEMFEELVECADCVRRQGNEWMGDFLDDFRAVGINVGQWTTAAQDEEEWRSTVGQGEVERFMATWIAIEKVRAGLRHAVVCLNVTARTKEKKALSKRVRSGSLAIVN